MTQTHNRFSIVKPLLGFALLCLAIGANSVGAAGIKPVLLKYELKAGGTKVGFINTEIKSNGGGKMTSTSTTEVSAAFKMLGLAPEITEKVWFNVDGGKYKPTKYFEKRTGRKAYESNVIIDWRAKKLNFTGGESLPIPSNDILQLGTIPLSMIMQPASDLSGRTINVVAKKGVRKFKVGVPAATKVDTVMGSVHAIKIPAQRLDKPSRKLAVWLAPDYGNIPVRIETVSKKRTTVLSLIQINGKKLFSKRETQTAIGSVVSR